MVLFFISLSQLWRTNERLLILANCEREYNFNVIHKKVAYVDERCVPTTGKVVQSLLGFSRHSIIFQSYTGVRWITQTRFIELNRERDSPADFKDLNVALNKAPVISPTDFTQEFCVGTDTSLTCLKLSIRLLWAKSSILHLCLDCCQEVNYSKTHRELQTVLFCFLKFRHWFSQVKFLPVTDHCCLLYLHKQSAPNNLLLAYYESIFSSDYELTYAISTLTGFLDCSIFTTLKRWVTMKK